MKKWMLGLKIRAKLLAAFGSILLFSIVLIVLSINSINKIIFNKNSNEKIEVLKLCMKSQELAIQEFISEGFKEKEFQEEGKSAYLNSFNTNHQKALTILSELGQNFSDSLVVRSIHDDLSIVRVEFDSLINLFKKRGFKDYGLEGSLRKAVHEIENSKVKFDKAELLTLRRNEKDFFLRKDLKYKDDFLKNASIFETSISKIKDPLVPEILKKLDIYRTEFLNIIDLETEIGLTTDNGVRGKLNKQLDELRLPLETFSSSLRVTSEGEIINIIYELLIIFLIQLIVGVFLAIFYAGLITIAIKEIRNAIQMLAEGTFPEKLIVKTTEEIGQTKIALNLFLDRLQAATIFAHQLGDGNLRIEYESRFSNDVLAKSIIQMQQKLKEADERQTKINWVNEGAAQFSEIIKNEAEDISKLGDKIISFMVKYLDVNQGALYIIEDEKLKRISTYAYGKKRYIDQTIEIGQGLVGQCAIEKQTIYLKQIPSEYVKISSGLGEATPNNVIIIPILLRDQMLGVLELASFKVLEQFRVKFIENITENIASLIFNKQSASQTQKLLNESQERAEILAQQEEEMRQNAEELQATQEEMTRQKQELEREIVKLKRRLEPDQVYA